MDSFPASLSGAPAGHVSKDARRLLHAPRAMDSNVPLIIAIDGPAASGKGTLARRLAAHFKLALLDTGGLYRAAALHALVGGGDPADPGTAAAAAGRVRAADLADPRLREERVAQAASVVAAIPAVRQ